MSTSIRFPSNLPVANRQGFGDTHEESRSNVEMETGVNRYRRMFTVAPRVFDVKFSFTQAEFLAFELWYYNTIKKGQYPFDIQLLDDDQSLVWYTVFWTDDPKSEVVGEYSDNWLVTGSVRSLTEAFAVRNPGTNELRSLNQVESLNTGALFIRKVFRGLTTISVDNTGRLNPAGMRGVSILIESNTGKLSPYYLYGLNSVSETNTGKLNVITASLRIEMHFEGSNGSTTFTDTGSGSSTWTGTGGTALTTTSPIAGSSSLKLTAATDYLRSPYSIGSNSIPAHADFELLCSFQTPTANPSQVYLLSIQDSSGSAAGTVLALYIGFLSSDVTLFVSDGTTRGPVIAGAHGLSVANTPVTYKIKMVGNTLSLEINGSSVGTYDMTGKNFPTPSGIDWRIGQAEFTSPGTTQAGLLIDDFKLTV